MNDSRTIRIVVVDDHALFRAGLISLLSQAPWIEIVGEGGNGREALQVVMKTQPDVVLLDLNMPVMDGVTTVTELRKISDCRILMLTISKRQEDLLGAIRAGADGYLLKNSEPEELQNAIKISMRGKSILSPDVTAQVIQVIRDSPIKITREYNLTKREMDVLIELSKGKTNPQIAQDMHISENTVKTHIRNIMDKLDTSSRTEAVRIARQNGLLI